MVKPQDILVLLKIVGRPTKALRQSELAAELSVSQAEVNNALRRAKIAGFVSASLIKGAVTAENINRNALLEYLVHGLKYASPGRMTEPTRGMFTAWGVPAGREGMLATDSGGPVWPSAQGTGRGPGLKPIYPTVPFAAARDAQLYDMLALIDAIRVGRIRDQDMAAAALKRRLCL